MAVANWFAEHDDIRNHLLLFKGIESVPGPAVAGLDFIRDTNPACLPDVLIDFFLVAGRSDDLAPDTWIGFGDESRQTFS